jgi:hypothetical protein
MMHPKVPRPDHAEADTGPTARRPAEQSAFPRHDAAHLAQRRLVDLVAHSPRLAAQRALVGAEPATAEGVVQRLPSDISATSRMRAVTLPEVQGYWGAKLVASNLNGLLALLTAFDLFEHQTLQFARYERPAQQEQSLDEGLRRLNAIIVAAQSLRGLAAQAPMAEDKTPPYHALLTELNTLIAAASLDHQLLNQQFQVASGEVDQALDDAFVSQTVFPFQIPNVGEAGFKAAREAGVLQVQMVKWWRSGSFTGHNAELRIYVHGHPWAIAHVKWKPGQGLTDAEPYMSTFKAFDGSSIYGGNINDGSIITVLLGAIAPYAGTLPTGPYTNVLV